MARRRFQTFHPTHSSTEFAVKCLNHLNHRSLPAQGWLAFARAASVVLIGGAGSIADSRTVARIVATNEMTNQMVPGEGSA